MDSLQIAFKTEINKQEGKDEVSFLYGDNLFIVAEGVGGEYLGKIAKEKACYIIYESFFRRLSEVHSPEKALTYALKEANDDVLNERRKLGRKMAASVSVVYIMEKIMYFTHLGDSRIYCLHEGELNQLTRDHTLIEEDPFTEVKFHDPHLMHALTEGLGIHEKPAIEVKKYLLEKKDLIFMTTEGLTKLVSNREILRLSLKTKNLEKLCGRLIDLAGRKGGNGNMTVGIMRIGKLSKELRNLLIAYFVLFLLILSVMGGYYIKYNERGSKDDHVEDTRTIQPGLGERKKTVVNYEIKKPPVNHIQVDIPVKEEAEHQGEEEPDDDIYEFISNWKTAWENTAGEKTNIKSYMSFYSDDFVSKSLDKNGWKNDKADKGKRKRWIRVEVMDIRISKLTEENQIEVRFFQSYRSSNYSGKSDKILIFKKEETGWKIISENDTE